MVELRFYHIYRAVNRGWGIQPPKPPISLEMGCKFCSTQKRDQFFDNYWSFPNILTILSLNLLFPRKKIIFSNTYVNTVQRASKKPNIFFFVVSNIQRQSDCNNFRKLYCEKPSPFPIIVLLLSDFLNFDNSA